MPRKPTKVKTGGKAPKPDAPPPAAELHPDQGGDSPGAVCPVVAFGASAGGLEAFQEVLHHLPADTGLGFVLIQHLDPHHESILSNLLSKSTPLEVVQVRDGMPVRPNRIHVIPPNTSMTLHKGVLALTSRPQFGPHMPIDEFFRSLAEDEGNKAIAVILSGTASDGTIGLKAIKAAGGITIAQDESARYDAMPRSAIASGCIDLVLSPEAIARELERLAKHPYVVPKPAPAAVEAQSAFDEIFTLLRAATGVDFTLYKHGTLQRRILRRMAVNKIDSQAEYARLLRENRPELKALFQDILISVTGFFREPATFEGLRKLVFPAIFKERSQEDPVRIWVPGCSTGEEVYSVAIVLMEHMRENDLESQVQIFGTDLSDAALERARAGLYPESIAADVSAERLRRFFVKVEGRYQIHRSVRDLCVFAQQNLVKDPPFSKLDVVSCRNVLIYLGPVLQSKVMRLFHYGLKPGGFLVLGLSETVGSSGELFSPVDRRLKIYERRLGAPGVNHLDLAAYDEARFEQHPRKPPQVGTAIEMQRRLDQFILSKFSPAGVLVDEDLTVVQFHGHTAPFLEHASGEPNLSLMSMIRHELALPLKKTFEKARRRNAAAKSELLHSVPERRRSVRISVHPIVLPGLSEPRYLIIFEEFPELEMKVEKTAGGKQPGALGGRVRELQQELGATRQYLESVIEEHQATTEELKSANEEVQSSNEELQSTNEELLTAKEELQSTNEELSTVNEEMNSRNAELAQMNNDLTNLLTSVNIPIVMLGNDLRVRRFTPQAEKVLNLLPSDVGRPVGDFKPKINVPDLEHLFLDAIENLRVNEREVQDRDGRWFSMWVRPYRTSDNKIDGAVMVLFDITERKQAAEARYRRLFEASKDGILLADAETGEIIDLNPFMTKSVGISRESALGTRYWDLDVFAGTSLDERSLQELKRVEILRRFVTVTARSGERCDLEVLANVYPEGDRRVIQFNLRDMTERKRLEDAARRMQQEHAMDAMGRLAGGVAHEFNNALTAIVGYSELLARKLESGDPAREDAEHVRAAAARATTMTRQLLAFGSHQVLQPQVLDLNRLLEDLAGAIRASLHPGIELRLLAGPELEPVRVDRSQMERVILQLAMNARDAMRDGGTLTIQTEDVEIDEAFAREHPAVPPGSYVALAISDTGPGMSDEAAQHLFEPFYTGRPGAGGLDLSSIYGFVRQSLGYIWAFSELGRGSAFRIYLPRVDRERIPEKVEPAQPVTGNILLVEDEPMVRHMVAQVLTRRGFEVTQAGSGAEAVELASGFGGRFDLLLSDIVMPNMNGAELAERFRAEHPEVPVILMSGHTEDEVVRQGVLNGRFAFIQKPFTPAELVKCVQDELTRRMTNKE